MPEVEEDKEPTTEGYLGESTVQNHEKGLERMVVSVPMDDGVDISLNLTRSASINESLPVILVENGQSRIFKEDKEVSRHSTRDHF